MTTLTAKELKVKIGQRGTIRASTTRAVKAAEALLSETPVNLDKAKITLGLLKDDREKLMKFDEEILSNIDDEKLDEELSRIQTYQDDVQLAIETIAVQIDNAANPPQSPSHLAPQSRDTAPKLPKLEIEKFNGDPLLWEQFWDNFKACIHDRKDLPVIDKFKYLKSFLDGEALRMVEGYRLTVANYDEVLQALKERFGDPEMAIFAHFDALISLAPTSYNLGELRTVLDSCESHIRSLVALGLPETTFGVVFTPLILSKLPKQVKMEIYRKNGSQKWSLAHLRTLLEDEIRAREKCERVFGGHTDSAIKQKQPSAPQKISSTWNNKKGAAASSSLLNTPAQSTNRRPPGCAFCSKGHYSAECRTYSDVNSRRKCVQDRCYCCLRIGHNAGQCRSKKPCYYCRKDTHHQSLCPKQFGKRENDHEKSMVAAAKDMAPSKELAESAKANRESSLSLQSPNSKAILQTALVDVKGKSIKTQVRFYFDTGGSRSFISTAAAKKIGATLIGEESVSVGRFRDSHHSTITYKIYEFDVCLPNGNSITVRMSAETTISCPIQLVPIDCSAFANIKLAEPLVTEPTMVPIDVLIGNDYYYTFIGQHQMRCGNGLVLLESPFGFVTGGSLSTSDKQRGFDTSLFLHANTQFDDPDRIEQFWNLEDLGIKDNAYQPDDELAVQGFNKTVKFENNRYSVKWPWKDQHQELNTNYHLALGRLKSLTKRIENNSEVMKKYDETISDQRDRGVIEDAPDVPDGPEQYLPHHCVITPSKNTTNLRIVYDASAKASKLQSSLNECMYRGPVFMVELIGILIRWRLPKVALVSDIEKAFLQVGLQRSDRDVTRFLWLKDFMKPVTRSNLQIYRFCRVPFGIIASPFLLAATVRHHLQSSKSSVASSILNNIYVDNVFGLADDAQQSVAYYKEAKSLLADASMNLREWVSNSSEFLNSIPPSDRGSGSSTTVLGLNWNCEVDQFTIPVSKLPQEVTINWTKRRVLQALASVFDPCGLVSPVVIRGKILMQTLWKHKCGWDESLPTELIGQWDKVRAELQQISAIQVPRQLSQSIDNSSEVELHCFCDASKQAYSTAIFLKIIKGGRASSDLVFSKSRVAPVKSLSIPRLELLAVLIGVRALQLVGDQLHKQVKPRYLWTDSSCVLHWIKKKPVSTTFVQNRLREILSHSDVQFLYVPTAENPADLPTKGTSSTELRSCDLWWHGPKWLLEDRDRWPKQVLIPDSNVTEDTTPPSVVSSNLYSAEEDGTNCLLDMRRFSCLHKMLRVTAYCLRFRNACLGMELPRTSTITAQETNSALRHWVRKIQEQRFSEDLRRSDTKATKLKCQLGIFAHADGTLRCRSRYLASADKDENDCPKLLPKNHPFTDLIIMDCHRAILHSGVKHTLAEMRKRYWVPHGRNQIKRVLKTCNLCRYYSGQSYPTPPPANLPECRTQQSNPFDVVGVDYIGPLLIRSTQTKQISKVWICLFTCASIRAIHLEIITDLSTEQFLLCFRRFMAAYGRPKLIISDNAKHFRSADQTLNKLWKEVLNSNDVQSLSSKNQICWKFITELAPWMGGFYERMVGLVKSSLKKTIHNRCLSLIELQTVICEVTSVINSRPQLYSEESVEQDYLCPAHFLMKSTDSFPSISLGEEYKPKPLLADELIGKWKRIQAILNGFWKSWQSSYLQSLRDYVWKPNNRNTSGVAPSIGTVVIIKDNAHRSSWKLGVITELLESHDGKVRSAVVRLPSGNVTRRPVKLLTPLESTAPPTGIGITSGNTSSYETAAVSRTSAGVARGRIKDQLMAEDTVDDYE